MFLEGIKVFSVQAIKKLYCQAAKLTHCQYVNCNEVGFSQ